MPKVDYAAEKKAAFEMFSKDDLEKIKKGYPLKRVREAKIHEMLQKGFSRVVVSELSGMSYNYVWKISNFGTEKINDNDLIKIQAALDRFNNEIKSILKTTK